MRAMKVNTRWATLWEVPEAFSFLMRDPVTNRLDRGIFDYPTIKIVRAENQGAVAYMPVQTAIVLESIGFRDGASAQEKLESATAMTAHVASEACRAGVRELYFLSSDDRTDQAAMENLGFEPVKAYRKRLICE